MDSIRCMAAWPRSQAARTPPIAALTYVGVSGDGDSLSIGVGQLVHVIRRNVNMLYLIENNGVYGLTKGQFSASADIGTKAKRGETNSSPPIDPVLLALTLGATFVARSFSGDKAQLVPLIQAGMRHNGFALIDVLSPCVTFNDHEGSTKSYGFTREHYHAAVETDFVPHAEEIAVDYPEGESIPVSLHDGSRVILRKLDPTYDPTDRSAAYNYIEQKLKQNEYVTGLIHIDETDSHRIPQPESHREGSSQQHPIRETLSRRAPRWTS